jgi:hypothetical protein
MAPESSRQRLPFEPTGKGADKSGKASKKAAKSAPVASKAKAPKAKKAADNQAKVSTAEAKKVNRATANGKGGGAAAGIPQEVSDRMLRRMLVFSGMPTVLGVITFFVSYYLVVNRVVELPPYFVLLLTLGCFGLGVVGLTYGVLSASWDEGRPGSRLGLEEFQVNFGRMTSAWGTKSER